MNEHASCSVGSCSLAKEGPPLALLNTANGINCRSVQELGLLFSVSQTLEKSLDLGDIIRPALNRLRSFLGLNRGSIAIRNRDTGGFLLAEAVGLQDDVSPDIYLQFIRPIVVRTMEKGDPVIVPKLEEWTKDKDIESHVLEPLLIAQGIGLVSVPLRTDDEVIGALSIECSNSGNGWESTVRILTMIASIVAQAARVRRDAAEQLQSLRAENERLQEEIAHGFRPNNMIGNSSIMKTVYYHIEQVANSSTSVLVRGESGTGKELVAKALHEKSPRKKKPFVKFNCAALPDSIIESELFGHEKGAFTGALAMRKGRFEAADGGTIFLDEIGDISQSTQIKLLRVLQEREFERVGSQETRRVDVRVVAATSRNLEEMIEEGAFREDLYYRLNVFPIYMPPLRERKCDILMLADHFIDKFSKRLGQKRTRISSAAIDMLVSYHWAGNVRELENCIERAVLLAKGQSIKAHHLPPTLQKKTKAESSEVATLEDAVQALEREMIVDALKETGSNLAEAARRLGITERKAGLRVKKYGIDLARFKN
ncbi:sigma-54-dependent Fis family transcriptional regulator [Pelagicoccus albus]|uniref:Sigma 54-interacting transcriptional regulator n=1 Tax=Pelagicoccus albus TaxID=415222 RepID=A0A7X1B5W6_9BACT|nr:sigma 54-interacting transcriptional regulator [Pelagicoccus albus]MBC2606192.1 sigma 54-interacting transcriptional regulator [Pelagicoccus albus]